VRFPVVIGLRPSFFLRGAGLLAHGVAASALLGLDLGLGGIAALALVVLGALLAWRAGRPSIVGLKLLADGRIEIAASLDEWRSAEVIPPLRIHPWLTVLRVRSEDSAHVLAIAPDSLACEDFRRLRLWLAWRRRPGTDLRLGPETVSG